MLYVSPEFRYARTDDCNWCLRLMIINRIAFGTLELRTTFASIFFSIVFILSLEQHSFRSPSTEYFISCSPALPRRLAINRISLFAACSSGAASWFHAAVRYF
jgi:hypothetical protein